MNNELSQILLLLLVIIISNSSCTNHPTKGEYFQHGIKDKEYQETYAELRKNDSQLFDLGFNQCDTIELKKLISDDFEFYHDQSGITDSKERFIQTVSGLCNMSYRATRELKKGSLELFLLKNNGTLYGAIQKGEHMFYGKEKDKPKYLTSTASFTHIWIKEEGMWKLKRVLSYNHKAVEH